MVYKIVLFALFVLHLSPALAENRNAEVPSDSLLVNAGIYNVKSFGAIGNGAADDRSAIQAALDSADTNGGGVIVFPPGRYRISAPIVPKSNVTIKGSGLGAVIMANNYMTAAIGQPLDSLTNFTVENMTFEGGVIDEGSFPRRGRNHTPSFSSAISMRGNRKPGDTYPYIERITVKNCNIFKTSGLPVFFEGISGKVSVFESFFENCMDPGFTWCESVQFIGNSVKKGADNGVSVSRECRKAVIANNIFEDIAYWGVWCSGFLNDAGPETFSITGNVIKRCGFGGISLENGPAHGAVSGNTIDSVFNGPVDQPSINRGLGIQISGIVLADTMVKRASQIVISGNLIRSIFRGGISISGADDILITGNSFINIGNSGILVTSVTHNCAIYTDDYALPGADLNRIGIVGNSFVDYRNTPFSNYPYTFAIRNSTDSYQKNNTVIGYRQPLWEKLAIGGNTDSDQAISINAKSGAMKELLFQTAGLRRWDIRVTNAPEAGSNSGSDFNIIRRNDDGSVGGVPLHLSRADKGVRIGESTGRLGFFGVTPIAQYSPLPNTTGATVAELESEVNKLKALLSAYGLLVP